MNESFEFKHFIVYQDNCAMKVGTDGVLLGAWATGFSRVLDIGTGTGLIALMMAQRYPDAEIDAVEIDHDAARQAMDNVRNSPFCSRVRVIETSLQSYADTYRGELYDTIVSNPPYFTASLKNPDSRRSLARHTDSLSYGELFRSVGKLLEDTGLFSVVIPCDCEKELMSEGAIAGFFIVKKTTVRTKVGKKPKRSLLAFRRKREGHVEYSEETMMSDGNKPSPWYSELTSDFYLNV